MLPEYDPNNLELPKRSNYIGAIAWLRAVQECMGETVVFALDSALMCQGYYGGHHDEYLVWIYGNGALTKFNGVVVLSDQIASDDTTEMNGLRFTSFNRTITDALENETILDMQGSTEALSKYYYSNGESLDGISVAPDYQARFERLAAEAIEYYEN